MRFLDYISVKYSLLKYVEYQLQSKLDQMRILQLKFTGNKAFVGGRNVTEAEDGISPATIGILMSA